MAARYRVGTGRALGQGHGYLGVVQHSPFPTTPANQPGHGIYLQEKSRRKEGRKEVVRWVSIPPKNQNRPVGPLLCSSAVVNSLGIESGESVFGGRVWKRQCRADTDPGDVQASGSLFESSVLLNCRGWFVSGCCEGIRYLPAEV